MPQEVSHRPIKFQSHSWSQRGTKVNESHHGGSPLLKPTGIQIATNPLPGPTNREYRKLIGETFSSSWRVTQRQVKRHFTGNGTHQCRNGLNLLILYREQPRSTRIVVAYPRPAFSATKRTNYAPISFDGKINKENVENKVLFSSSCRPR